MKSALRLSEASLLSFVTERDNSCQLKLSFFSISPRVTVKVYEDLQVTPVPRRLSLAEVIKQSNCGMPLTAVQCGKTISWLVSHQVGVILVIDFFTIILMDHSINVISRRTLQFHLLCQLRTKLSYCLLFPTLDSKLESTEEKRGL